ncbi:tRNA (N(6)-L-threonylcarbamoyladenosine(37)-C(2))-methylthiotransferase MtaB [Candidatus Lucifugimonas marina]|uniref:tRNA (N(6)-L-threonylcarbamoyladenosine(37)-C(2))-methylthiotransferase MtaB n=1 Tax=Candidatus Lucifugimonas marina TaxID=3038979 RepID=A0AAJ5ZH55_9CHLR|nr:tRNA (N(6)-L-threonylcarbamoyladenosine(37)-C(2))-methylthiotransferase MtaB [SAR202 cluster bacterium JH702]MDG0868690.1 tRNA (N(6)-L-threonylcarbamoyladenosine(37)-C(2))-methylthiotransferase MtaB [SAR202 cluster bacterium JH639]WFG35321.1 tRNA (N(6)-L-threonylcarbamoyladenosine(37)-C(2))-methylthiotransferase MtaB [SAR202 cluster bacterium JH545]WFG39270.1 tRNA (N(6)-L-threonylcarbamoyladenosine(37)-C(2))-methylthiotransferase MtaB [SAR202 cluster bacterium JH1073]
MKVRIETHGCKLNTADSQRLANEFTRTGYAIAEAGEEPDVFVLNSCTVTHVADKKARQALSKARKSFPNAIVVAAGCYAESGTADLEELAATDLVIPNTRKSEIVSMVSSRTGLEWQEPAGTEIEVGQLLGRTRGAVKIQEGCDQVCAYCIVPKVRGRERSIPKAEIVSQVQALSSAGCPEVILTGTQLGSYGFDLENTGLIDMIRTVLEETDIRRLRVSSLQPAEFSDELLELWNGIGADRLCPHFHIPLQSGSDRILERMRRRYTGAGYLEAVAAAKAAVPGCSVTTDVISGFPGESEADHDRTVEILTSAELADAHIFPYSVRPGTSAAHFDDQVDVQIRSQRAEELREIADAAAKAHRMSFVGETRSVLWEGARGTSGLTDNYLRVRLEPGEITAAPVGDGDGLIEEIKFTRLERMQLIGTSAS